MFGDFSAAICPSTLARSSFGARRLVALSARCGRCGRGACASPAARPSWSAVWCPPTPGSYQSATNSEPSGATHTSDGRNQLVLALDDVDDLGLVARALAVRALERVRLVELLHRHLRAAAWGCTPGRRWARRRSGSARRGTARAAARLRRRRCPSATRRRCGACWARRPATAGASGLPGGSGRGRRRWSRSQSWPLGPWKPKLPPSMT